MGDHFGEANFQPGAAVNPHTTVELSFRCSNLIDMDFLSKSDPFLVVYSRGNQNNPWSEIFRTETIQDNLNPVWHKKLIMEYRFEERQMMRFEVYDEDSPSRNIQDHDFLGCLECSLGEIVASQSSGFSRNLTEVDKGSIHVIAEELLTCKEEITARFSGKKLGKKGFFSRTPSPFFEISRATESNSFILVHRSEVVKSHANPDWKPFNMKVSALCNSDHDRDLKIDVYNWNKSGSHSHIGTFHTNLRQLKQGPGASNSYAVSRNGKEGGLVVLQEFQLQSVPTFLDYVKGGTQLNFTVAIDFTASNGSPLEKSSLHYLDPTGAPNQYVTAIRAVGEIIQDYDSDNLYPALGFGARIPPRGMVSHEFFLNLDPNNPFCRGVDGILEAYNKSIRSVQLYGPTNFAPVIRHVAKFATVYSKDPTNYFVLLIITDGVITDFEATKQAIIDASTLPLSIIIVGVGFEDFSAMDALDSDDELLTCGSRQAKRDIVQFVELQRFIRPGQGYNKELLAREVLAEVPDQLVSFMKDNGFKPKTTDGL